MLLLLLGLSYVEEELECVRKEGKKVLRSKMRNRKRKYRTEEG